MKAFLIQGFTIVFICSMLISCNDYEYTQVNIKMTNQSDMTVNMFVEMFEEGGASNLLAPNATRTFTQAFTFTEEHPRTTLRVFVAFNGLTTSEFYKVSADTSQLNLVFTTAGISRIDE